MRAHRSALETTLKFKAYGFKSIEKYLHPPHPLSEVSETYTSGQQPNPRVGQL